MKRKQEEKQYMKVQSVDRVFDILETLAHEQEGLNLTEISQKIDLPTSTVFRLLSVLRDRHYVEKVEPTNTYRLGMGLVELTSMHLNNLELKTEAQIPLKRLSKTTGQVVFMGIIQESSLVYIDKYEEYNEMRKYCFLGQRHQLYCTALGKTLLTAYTDSEIKKLFKSVSLEAHTPFTITDIDRLLQAVHLSAERGYSFDDEEDQLGVICLAAPVYDYRGNIIAAISTSWSSQRRDLIESLIPLVTQTAQEISANMGLSRNKHCTTCSCSAIL
jgi:DNA-binding IclR family transcriptional regulator